MNAQIFKGKLIPRWREMPIMAKMALWQAPLIFVLSLEIGLFLWLFWAVAWSLSFLKRWWLQLPILCGFIALSAQLVPIKSADFFILMLVILLPFAWQLDEAEHVAEKRLSPAGLCPTIFLAGSVFIFQTQFIILLGLVAWLLSFLLWFTTALTGFRLSNISIRWVPIIAGAAATAAVIVTLFTFIPRLGTGFIPSFATASQKIGLTDSLAPGGMSDLLASTEIAFRAIPQSRTQPAPRYWRVFVLSEQSGNQWRRDGDVRLQNDFLIKDKSQSVRYQILTDTHDLNHIPIAGWPASSASAISDGYGYNAYGEALLNRGRDTRQIWITALDGRQHDYAYPPSTTLSDANPRLQAYGAEWRARVPDEDEFISSVMDSFARDFLYDTSVTYPEKDALDSFFFEGRVGYCSYFATTLATILRAGGLEAHVVTGYMGGEWNLYGNYWLVNQSDAHAWVEVKRQDGSWQRLDPTLQAMQLSTARFQGLASFGEKDLDGRPLTSSQKTGLLASLANVVAFADSLNLRVTLAIMNYGDSADSTDREARDQDNFALLLAAVGLAVAIIFAIIAVLRLSSYRAGQRPRSERRLELMISHMTEQRLVGETLIEHAQKLAHLDHALAQQACVIARRIYRNRFSRTAMDDTDERIIIQEIKKLERQVKITKKALKS